MSRAVSAWLPSISKALFQEWPFLVCGLYSAKLKKSPLTEIQ